MKYSIGILTIVILFAAFVLSGCDRPSNKMENAETSVIEAERDLEIAKSEVEAEVRIYRIENANQLMKYNRTISEIKKKIVNEPDREKRARLETKLEEYEVIHRDLKREMDNYKVSGSDNWDNFKTSFRSRMEGLGDSLDNFFSTTRTTTTSTNQH